MVTLASVVLVRRRTNASRPWIVHGTMLSPTHTRAVPSRTRWLPTCQGAVQYDVEAPGVQADARLRFPHVGMNCHPVGMAADATSYPIPPSNMPPSLPDLSARGSRRRLVSVVGPIKSALGSVFWHSVIQEETSRAARSSLDLNGLVQRVVAWIL